MIPMVAFLNSPDSITSRMPKPAQGTGASRFAQRQIERHRRLAPVADLGIAYPHRLPEGVTSLGIGYGTFILDHTPVRGFLDAEVQWTRNPSDAAVRRWSPSTARKKLASKRRTCNKAPVWQQFHASRSLPG